MLLKFQKVTSSSMFQPQRILQKTAESSYTGFQMCRVLILRKNQHPRVFCTSKNESGSCEQKTIPKLELSDAWLAVELSCVIRKEMESTVNKVTYWTYSTTVLQQIHSSRVRQLGFMANRVTHILTKYNTIQWNHEIGIFNSEDECSRGLGPFGWTRLTTCFLALPFYKTYRTVCSARPPGIKEIAVILNMTK